MARKTIGKNQQGNPREAVAHAIPTFTMSYFNLTKVFCKELNTLMSNFWWSQRDKERTMHWISWESLTLPKAMGGLRFQDM